MDPAVGAAAGGGRVALLADALALLADGNGFVAGVFFGSAARRLPAERCTGRRRRHPVSYVVWFLFGLVVRQLIEAGVHLNVVVYAVAALTVVRIVPVMLSLAGSGIRHADAAFLGWFGPRGLASIVFGLLAFLGLPSPANDLAAETMVITVLISIVVHGLTGGLIAAGYARRARA